MFNFKNHSHKQCFYEDSEEKGWTIIKKIIMKKLVGHSPDFIEALLMRMIFDIKHKRKHIKGLGLI